MSKYLFILYGAGNTGKTTTFNNVFEKIIKEFSSKVLVHFQRHGNGVDFLAVLKNENGQYIGIYSAGDGVDEIRYNLYQLNYYNCDFIIGASRTRGEGCKIIEKYADLFYGSDELIEWFKKEQANDKDNLAAQKELFSVIRNLLK